MLRRRLKQAHLYQANEEPYDRRDESYTSAEDDESYYCEMCDRDFTSEENLASHKKEHRLCGIDGCNFSAHSLLVERHISMQHSSGLYQKLKNLSTPEDIQKWLEERKKRYPTKANIELKRAEESEKIERGEIIKRKQDVVKRRKKKRSNLRDRRTTQRRFDLTFEEAATTARETYRGLCAFSGTMSDEKREDDMEMEGTKNETNNDDIREAIGHISDEEDLPVAMSKFPITSSGTLSLVANYGSDSDDDAPEEIPIKKIKRMDEQPMEKLVETASVSDKAEMESKQANSACSNLKYQKKGGESVGRFKNNLQNTALNRKRSKGPELLQKLLSRSIQHERNLICQCVKYIVDNHFFD